MRHILVLGDQLNKQVGPLAAATPSDTHILMIEAVDFAHAYAPPQTKADSLFLEYAAFCCRARKGRV